MPDKGVICISGGNGALGLVMGNWLLDKAGEFSAASWNDPKTEPKRDMVLET